MAVSDHMGGTVTHRRWVAVTLAALLAFLCQSFVTQTHLHVDPGARSVALAGPVGTAATLKTGQSSPDLPVCPICREIAHGGSYLLPTPVAFLASEPGTVWRVIVPPHALAPSQSSHAWRSRAPPRHLQA